MLNVTSVLDKHPKLQSSSHRLLLKFMPDLIHIVCMLFLGFNKHTNMFSECQNDQNKTLWMEN